MKNLSDNLKSRWNQSEAILFDMDGVITNSMPKHCKCWLKAFRDLYHLQVSPLEIYRREGEKSNKSVLEILALHGIKASQQEVAEFLEYKVRIFGASGKILFYKGIRSFLKRLHRSKKIALVTGTQRSEIEAHLSKSFIEMFDAVVTSTEVTHGKPHPEPYLRAMKILDISPSKAIVVENAPYGIRSARASGVFVIALPTSLPPEELGEADYVCASHEELYLLAE